TLVSTQSGDRQLIARWVERISPTGAAARQPSPYLHAAAAMVSEQTPIIFALDLRDALALPAVTRWIQLNSGEAAPAGQDPGPVAKVLAGVRGVTIKVAV